MNNSLALAGLLFGDSTNHRKHLGHTENMRVNWRKIGTRCLWDVLSACDQRGATGAAATINAFAQSHSTPPGHINNWMMSTNLPMPLDPSLARKQTKDLTARHPGHLLAMRSLTRRYNAALMTSLEEAGWVLLPSRQVFLIDDFARQCLPRRDVKRDEALWRRGDYQYEELSEMGEDDARRIVELYNMLYLDKYSRLNPAYTPQFVALTHRIGLIRYLALRDRDGKIQGFGGMHRARRHATMPLLGYNTDYPQDRGLYRLSFHAGTRYALNRQLLFNMSSGATSFKRNRGAIAEMEFTAYYLRHLPWSRRAPFEPLRTIANRIGMPLLRRYQL